MATHRILITMPIPTDEWKRLIEECLRRLSDENYQRLAWFNKHEEQTSPDEQICQILGDYQFEEFISSHDIGLSAQQKSSATELVLRLKKFGGRDPYKAIDDPEWKAIRADSKKVLLLIFGATI